MLSSFLQLQLLLFKRSASAVLISTLFRLFSSMRPPKRLFRLKNKKKISHHKVLAPDTNY